MNKTQKQTLAELIRAVDNLSDELAYIRADLKALHNNGNYRGLMIDDWLIVHENDDDVEMVSLSEELWGPNEYRSVFISKEDLERQLAEGSRTNLDVTGRVSYNPQDPIPDDIADDLYRMSVAEDKHRRYEPSVIKYWEPLP